MPARVAIRPPAPYSGSHHWAYPSASSAWAKSTRSQSIRLTPARTLTAHDASSAPSAIIGLNDQIAERFTEKRAFLRRRGRLISDLDLLIAATALHHDLTMLTFNVRQFERIPDLRVYGPN